MASGPKSSQHLRQERDALPGAEIHLAQLLPAQAANLAGAAGQPQEIVVVKHHHLAGAAAHDVELDGVGALFARQAKGGERVLGRALGRAAMGDHQRLRVPPPEHHPVSSHGGDSRVASTRTR